MTDWIGYQKTQHLTHIPNRFTQASSALLPGKFNIILLDQEAFDPYNGDAGNGLFPNGSYVVPVPDQNNVYTPWNTSLAKVWLSGLKNKPTIVTIDNEIEIASNTHQDMHPVYVYWFLFILSRS